MVSKMTTTTGTTSRPPLFIPILSLLLMLVQSVSGRDLRDETRIDFANPHKGFPFEKMVIDPSTSRLYVGGVNYLYDLQNDLSIRVESIIGPQDDSTDCYGRGECSKPRMSTDSHTKSLAVYDRSSKLIECSSLFQGRCRLRNLHNISESLAESLPMLANDANSSSVVFVGTGPPSQANQPGEPVLYVASTHVSSTNALREEVPAIASRSLAKSESHTEFQLSHSGVNAKSSIFVDRRHREDYKVEYVGGFEAGKFAYFATRQRRSLHDEIIQSRLVRVCTGDSNFYSYVEVPLDCDSKDGTHYNLLRDVHVGTAGYNLARELGVAPELDAVVYAVFEEGAPTSSRRDAPTGRSALCVYPLAQIEQIFKANIMDCYGNEGVETKLPWFTTANMCRKTQLKWESIECGVNVNTRIGGGRPVSRHPLLELNDARASSVTTNTTLSSTLVFMGTRDGRLVKAALEGENEAFVYETEQLANEPILQDLEFSEDGRFVFALTPNNVIRVPSSTCSRDAPTCAACMAKRDPHCGWCTRSNSCSRRDDCDLVLPKTTAGWLEYGTNACPNIKSVFPNQVQVSSPDFLNVTMENIGGSRSGKLRCVFTFPGGERRESEAALPADDGSMRCATPNVEAIPRMGTNQSSLIAKLSIVEATSGHPPPLASINFTFFDCRRFKTCSDCAGSPFPCDWCLRSNECVAGQLTEDLCRGQVFVNGMGRSGSSSRRGPSHCPHIFPASSSSIIHVAAGEKKAVSVKSRNIDPSFMSDFKCRFKVGDVVHDKLARRSGENIECDSVLFDKTGNVGFSVVWAAREDPMRSYALDDSRGIELEVYRCNEIASDCGTCLTLDTGRYACGWCAVGEGAVSEPRCVGPGQCPTRSPWLNSTQLCTHPQVKDFAPKKGPLGGNTTLTITGVNLGRSPSDIKTIMVANVECKVVPTLYVAPSTVVCVTGSTHRQQDGRTSQGPIIVQLKPDGIQYTGVSSEQFQYVEPVVHRLDPHEGPLAGGTEIKLTGEHLDAGEMAEVRIGGERCPVLARTSTTIVCRAPRADRIDKMKIEVHIDRQHVKGPFKPIFFTYVANPKLMKVDPERSIVAGGIKVDVEGDGFKMLQRPKMVIFGGGGGTEEERNTEMTNCKIISDSHMECLTPPLPPSTRVNALPEDFSYAFDFDGARTNTGLIKVYPNPRVEAWQEERYYRPSENYLTINGEHLNAAARDRDVRITIGGAECAQTLVAERVLTCKPPETKPRLAGGIDPEVVVTIGSTSFSAGVLSYDSPGLSTATVAIIVACILIMLSILILVLILYRRKSNTHARQLKLLKSKMDAIEMRVATECKEAFAELQTSLNAYTADLPLGTPIVPFHDYREYAARVLFPNCGHNHPAMRELEVDSSKAKYIEDGLREFHKLLMNKTFLLTMVRTMESNKYFLGKDRVYLGSLLMVVLQERMSYCTEILKQLLRELIDKTVEKRFQPKILFRRSESVAERMLAAWFSFLMHNYLTECAGKKLFDLYWAIKQQMEKGPQDALTLDARYSLSEEKLLRATFEFHEMMVFLAAEAVGAVPGGGGGAAGYGSIPEVPVRVLDCDTITQVKEKCVEARYRTLTFSERPRIDEVELEYRHPLHGRTLLQDVDASSKTEPGGWKKMNTLAHYGVPPNAVLVLSQRQSSLYNLSLLSEKSSLSLKNSPTLSRPNLFGGTNSSNHSKDSDGKLYHLVKPSEHGPADSQEKMVTEIYLTRLLMMKGTLQKFINDLLEAVFSSSRHATLPACVKYMFDFMDGQALEHGITDPEVTHAWKSNALPLRFWVNLIKNPHFVFDIPKPTKIEGCLSVVAQTLMDACSTQDHQLTKDSPSSKLLFAKDMFQYRDWVDSYYTEVAKMPPISDQDMTAMLNEESKTRKGQLQVYSALHELYKYLDQHKDAVLEALEHNEHAAAYQLPGRLQDLIALMESQRGGTGSDYDSNTLGLGYNSASRLMPRDRL